MIEESTPILTPENNILVFWEDTVQDGLASTKKGMPVFAQTLKMRVSVPGDNKAFVEYEVERTYDPEYPHPIYQKMRRNEECHKAFGKYINDYKGRQAGPQTISGMPIEQWPLINRSQAANLRHNGVYSVEALATLSDAALPGIGMDARKLVQQAKDYLATAKNSAAAMEAQARERRTEERFAALEEQHRALAEALASLPEAAQATVQDHLAKRSPGRPRKEAA